MKNRKSQIFTVVFFVRLVIAIIIVFAIIGIGSKLFRLSDKGLDSFYDLAEKIPEAKNGDILSTMLVMDEKTALFGFDNSSEKMEYWIDYDFTPKCFSFIKRPDDPACEDQSCVCLCRKGHTSSIHDTCRFEVYCNNLICTELGDLKYADYQIETAFYSPIDYKTNDQQLGDWKAELSDNRLIGGFVFYRGLDWWQTASNSEKAATLLRFPDTASRERPVYIEKYGDITAVCLNTPCIPQSEKDRIDDEIKTVVIATHQTLNSTIELCRQGIIAKEFIIPVEFSGYTNYAVKYYPISETFEFWKDYQPIEGVDDISMKPCPDVEKQSYVHGENIHLQSEGPNHCCLSTP